MRPLAVAITGGIGAGKSAALAAFARRGAATLSADEVVHALYADDEIRERLRRRWGARVFVDGEIDRAAVAEIVFADDDELSWLERLLHPRVVERQRRWRDELAARPDAPAVCAIEIPLLYETGGERGFDAVVVITAPADVRKRRSGVRDLELRERRLLAEDEKTRRADFAYVNDGTLEELDAFVHEVLAELQGR